MAVTTRDLKEWGITKILDDMMCDELFGPEKTMTPEPKNKITFTETEGKLYGALGRLPINDSFTNSGSIDVILAIRAMIDEAIQAALGEKKDD